MAADIEMIAIRGIDEIRPGDNLARMIADAAVRMEFRPRDGDVFVVAQKVVSKAEGRLVSLDGIEPGEQAMAIAARQSRDPRLIEVILRESASLIRADDHVLITETHHGFICANAGVDRSNVVGDEWVSLLPLDPDESARGICETLSRAFGVRLAVIVTDTFGRAWREGLTNAAIAVAGIEPLIDRRGARDDHGKDLSATVLAVADEIAAATGLLMQKTARLPVVVLRGCHYLPGKGTARRIIRPRERDLFR